MGFFNFVMLFRRLKTVLNVSFNLDFDSVKFAMLAQIFRAL